MAQHNWKQADSPTARTVVEVERLVVGAGWELVAFVIAAVLLLAGAHVNLVYPRELLEDLGPQIRWDFNRQGRTGPTCQRWGSMAGGAAA